MSDEWKDAITLEEAVRNLLKRREIKKALALVLNLPVDRRIKYRQIWKEEMGVNSLEPKDNEETRS